MSGVTGDTPIPSRKEFDYIFDEYKKVISKFPGYIDVTVSGSYNSNKSKETFGDMDLILTVDGPRYDNDKKRLKIELAEFLTKLPEKIITKFTSDKYAGRRYYNSGEIITVSFQAPKSDASHQIDNIVSLSKEETGFKSGFLDMPAAKQGLLLGAVKVALIEQDPKKILKSLKIRAPEPGPDQELEFNASYKEIQLRLITYVPGTFKEEKREVIWSSTDWEAIKKILYTIDTSLPFEELLKELKKKFSSSRAKTRMAGVFKSMVSIKSGEVGKPKGADKQKALDMVAKALQESAYENKIPTFKQFINR